MRRHADRGGYEVQLVARLGLGEQGFDIIASLPEAELTELCEKQAIGGVTDHEIGQLKLRLFRIEPGGLDQRTPIEVAPIDRMRPSTLPSPTTGDRVREMRSLQLGRHAPPGKPRLRDRKSVVNDRSPAAAVDFVRRSLTGSGLAVPELEVKAREAGLLGDINESNIRRNSKLQRSFWV